MRRNLQLKTYRLQSTTNIQNPTKFCFPKNKSNIQPRRGWFYFLGSSDPIHKSGSVKPHMITLTVTKYQQQEPDFMLMTSMKDISQSPEKRKTLFYKHHTKRAFPVAKKQKISVPMKRKAGWKLIVFLKCINKYFPLKYLALLEKRY